MVAVIIDLFEFFKNMNRENNTNVFPFITIR